MCHLDVLDPEYKDTFTLRLFGTRLMTEAEKFGLPIGQVRELTNVNVRLYKVRHVQVTHDKNDKR